MTVSSHIETPASRRTDTTAPARGTRSIARRFGRNTGQRRPVSAANDAKLRAAHVRAAAFRPELY